MKFVSKGLFVAAVAVSLSFPVTGDVQAHGTAAVMKAVSGSASWYGGKFHGRKTANGERFNMNDLTAAHRTLPFGTRVRVTNEANGRSVVVRINDRGPYHGNRVIDLSRKAAESVGLLGRGVGRVKLEVLGA